MKKNKLLAVLLALAMTLSLLPTAAFAAEGEGVDCSNGCSVPENHVAAIGTMHYTSLADAIAAAKSGDTVTLLKDVTESESINLANGSAVTIDMNGHNITFTGNFGFILYGNNDNKGGSLSLTGKGTLNSAPYGAFFINGDDVPDGTTKCAVSIGKDVTVSGGAYNIWIQPDTSSGAYARNVTVDIYGTVAGRQPIYVNGNIHDNGPGAPKINIHSGATIECQNSAGIYLAGYAKTTIDKDVKLTSDGNVINIAAGELTVNGGTFVGGNGLGSDAGAGGSISIGESSAIYVKQHGTNLPLIVTINGGSFSAAWPLYQAAGQSGANAKPELVSLTVNGGTFTSTYTGEEDVAAVYSADKTGFITGGTYSDLDCLNYLAEGANVTVELTGDINLVSPLELAIPGKAVVLDLNNHSLNGRVNLKGGTLTLRNGKVIGEQPLNVYGSSDTNATNYSVLNVESTVTVNNADDDKNSVVIFPNNGTVGYGAVANVAGTINGTVFVSGNLGNSESYNDAMRDSNRVNIKSNATVISAADQAIAMNGAAVVTIENGATVTGREAVGIKRGALNVTGGTLTATGAKIDPATANNNGTESTGAAISMTSTYNYAGHIQVNVSGGTIVSKNNAALYVGHSQKNSVVNKYEKGFAISVTGGSFCGASDVSAVYIADAVESDHATYTKSVLTGGTFSSNPATTYLADNTIVRKDSETSFVVLAKTGLTSGTYLSDPSGATATNYYVTNNNNGTWTVYYSAPSYDDGGSSTTTPSQPTTSTETKPDGSTTTTETKPDGTVTESNTSKPTTDASGNTSQTTTETSTGKDGVTESKTETVTKPDGSASSTTESTTTKPDGTKTESTTETTVNKDGSTASTTTATTTNKDGTVTESKTEATTSTVTNKDGSTTETKQETTTTSTGSKTESTTVTTVNKDGSTTATTTATTTDKAGTVTESKTESTTNKNGTTTEKTTTTETKANGTVTESKTETTINKDGSSKATTTATVTKADGTKVESKTTATTSLSTNKATGTVTETKKETTTTSDGVKSEGTTVTQIRKDGTVTSTETVKASDSTGTTATKTTTLDAKGEVTTTAEVSVSSKAITEAAKTGVAVTIPVEVTATKSASTAPTVSVSVPKTAESVKVELPVQNVTPGTVAVIVNADGTEKIVSTSMVTENGVALKLDGSATVKLVDNAKRFTDVPETNVFYNEISSLSARNIMIGVSNEKFDLHNSVTLNQTANVAGRITGAVDVSDFNAGVAWGQANGLKIGNNAATRGDVLKALYIAAGSPAVEDTSILTRFKDASSIPADLAAIAAWAAQNGILKGNMDGTAGLSNNVTRGQACALAGRTMGTLA